MKPWKKPKVIYEPMYYANVWLFNDIEAATKYCKKQININPFEGSESLSGMHIFLESKDDGSSINIICVDLKEKDWIVTLTHELLHLVHNILKERGVPSTYDNTEVQAYLLSYLQKKAFKHFKVPMSPATKVRSDNEL